MTVKNLREDRRPADLWYWNDWFSSFDVRSCSLAARGLWMDMIGIMRNAEIKGSLTVNGKQLDNKDLANISGVSEREELAAVLGAGDGGLAKAIDLSLTHSHKRYVQVNAPTADNGSTGCNLCIIATLSKPNISPSNAEDQGLAELVVV